MVVDTMTQSASPGYSDTEDRDELANALRQESGNLKSEYELNSFHSCKVGIFITIHESKFEISNPLSHSLYHVSKGAFLDENVCTHGLRIT